MAILYLGLGQTQPLCSMGSAGPQDQNQLDGPLVRGKGLSLRGLGGRRQRGEGVLLMISILWSTVNYYDLLTPDSARHCSKHFLCILIVLAKTL